MIRPILLGEIVRNNQKTGFHAVFLFVAIWAPPYGPKKVPKGPQVGETFGVMSKLKNKPLTKLLGLFFLEKWSETTRKQFFILFVSTILGPFGHPQMDPNRYPKVHKRVGCTAK
jgi:hypothetical protein